jgi:signal transduction histidine kinase
VAERQSVELQRTQGLEREHRGLLEAEAMNRLKDEFLSTLSHELRTPLNAILGWADILQKGARDNATIDRGLRVIKRNAEAQAHLVADMMDVSSIIGGRLTLKLDLVSLRTVLEAALESVEPAVEAKCITIETAFADMEPTIGDRDRLQQIVWNLLSNAIKFTPKGGRVRVELRAHEGDIVLSVADSGQGIDRAFLPHVFDRFSQADGSVTRVHCGLGLGMAIVRHLVELHGGHVTAASDGKDQGATFTMTLPVGASSGSDRLTRPESIARLAVAAAPAR